MTMSRRNWPPNHKRPRGALTRWSVDTIEFAASAPLVGPVRSAGKRPDAAQHGQVADPRHFRLRESRLSNPFGEPVVLGFGEPEASDASVRAQHPEQTCGEYVFRTHPRGIQVLGNNQAGQIGGKPKGKWIADMQ